MYATCDLENALLQGIDIDSSPYQMALRSK